MKKQTEQEFMDAIPKPQTIWFKLWKAKQEIEAVKKNAKNPHFKSNYADINSILDAVEPVLLKYHLLLLQPIENGKVYSRIYDVESGEFVESLRRMTMQTRSHKQLNNRNQVLTIHALKKHLKQLTTESTPSKC